MHMCALGSYRVSCSCLSLGIYQAKVMNEQGKSMVIFDRYHMIGGVWEFYGNEYSRVNTSEKLD